MPARHVATILAATLALAAAPASLAANPETPMARAVLATLGPELGHARIATWRNLASAFRTRSDWALVVAEQANDAATDPYDRPSAFCLVHDGAPDCSEALFLDWYRQRDPTFGRRPFQSTIDTRVVLAPRGEPRLFVQACMHHAFNGSCGVATFLLAYDRRHDRFRIVFGGVTGSNNNEETRFVERGPLKGAVIVATPTSNAPFAYWVEVQRPRRDGTYHRVLRYRGRTGYGDGDPRPVIDAEMPTIRRRLNVR